MERLVSNKGGIKFAYEGYIYTKQRTGLHRIKWKCSKKQALNCRGTLSTDLEMANPQALMPHTHAESQGDIRYTKARQAMKQRGSATMDAPSQIYAEG